MPGKTFSVDQAVRYQLNESDSNFSQGSGVVTQVGGDVVAIKPDAGCAGISEVHRINVNGTLMLNKP
ncbi:MAG: hypothetical protein ACNFW9_03870 [Candidatus Kerfeldbacteria bacterium]